MREYEVIGYTAAALGGWAFLSATANRVRLAVGRLSPRRKPKGLAGIKWRMEHQAASSRAGRWQAISLTLIVIGLILGLIARMSL
jgi:hypothetical protein